MPPRHRTIHSAPSSKLFTLRLESCSRSAGISVHVALETPFTIDRNMQFDSILVRQFLESRLMAGHRPLKSADVGSTPTFPTILFTGGLLVSQSRFEREPRRSDSYSVIHCPFIGLATTRRQIATATDQVCDQLADIVGKIDVFGEAVNDFVHLGQGRAALEGQVSGECRCKQSTQCPDYPQVLFEQMGGTPCFCADLFQCLALIVLAEIEEIFSHAPLRCRLPGPSRTAELHGQRQGRATRYEE